jgi:hypothetical protein
MSGPLRGVTPWGRSAVAAVKPEDREVIEDAIPDGCEIVVGAARSKGDWTLSLRRAGEPVAVASVYHQRTVEYGAVSLLQLAAIEDVA